MLATLDSAAVYGVDAYIVRVEVDLSLGMPSFAVVGLPDTAVQESRERVRSAVKNSNFEFPLRRITVNLAPADVKKEGPSFDLPIALGILIATEQLRPQALEDYVVAGELSLDGRVNKVAGALPIALGAKAAGKRGLIVPAENSREASVVEGLEVFGVESLYETACFLEGLTPIQREQPVSPAEGLSEAEPEVSFDEVKGQDSAKRALEIAAAGAHNVLMVGPPGSGKTMLARRLPNILPPLSLDEALEVTKLYSVAALLSRESSLVTQRAFRAPHHSVSSAGLVGGGRFPRPGEVSLAHHGVLFLDEFPEFHRDVLEMLRQPMEDGEITISRAAGSLTYPARFMLVAAMNPCPCGYYSDPARQCTCRSYHIQRYLMRISGPLLDRIDMQVEVPRLPHHELVAGRLNGGSDQRMRNRVMAAREAQRGRFAGLGYSANAHMRPKDLDEFCPMDKESRSLLSQAIEQLGLSPRAYDRVRKLARTIADLEASEQILLPHVAEAIQYRSLDRKLWG